MLKNHNLYMYIYVCCTVQSVHCIQYNYLYYVLQLTDGATCRQLAELVEPIKHWTVLSNIDYTQ